MTKIGIDVNGVLRDTTLKFEQLYQKYLIDVEEEENVTYELSFSGNSEEVSGITENTKEDSFKYEIISDVDTDNLINTLHFQMMKNYILLCMKNTLWNFLVTPSTKMTTFNTLNDLYLDIRDNTILLFF